MLQFDIKRFDLPFEYPFKISKGWKENQATLVFFLATGAQFGIGEATEILYYDNTIEKMQASIATHQKVISQYAFNGPERFHHFLHHLFEDNDFIVSALDCAAWDIWSKLHGKPVYEMLGLKWENIPPTDYTLGIASSTELISKIKAHPYPIYKLKVNKDNASELLQTVLENSTARIRIDANEGLDKAAFQDLLPLLNNERIELIEQPFHKEDEDSMAFYKENCKIPMIADEAITNLKSLIKEMGKYDGVNIKLSKCGGITPAFEMIKMIKQANKKVMLGSMSESNIGAAALAQLLPLADYADIDGPLLLKEQVGTPLLYDAAGNISFSEKVGIGIKWQ